MSTPTDVTLRKGCCATYFDSYVEGLRTALAEVDPGALEAAAEVLLQARRDDRQVLILGNGGSAAMASHLACDLGKGTVARTDPEFRRFRAIALSDNTALLTAIGNDLSFAEIFVEQLRALLNPLDVVVAISASGNSPNVLAALEFARSRGAVTIGLLGFGGGRALSMVDVPLVVSSRNYGIAEDFHGIVQHAITQYLRRALTGPARRVLFLDRDGVINERPAPHTYVTRREDFRLLPGVSLTLRALNQLGFGLVVVTNQQGVGKGLIEPAELDRIHTCMAEALSAEGVQIDGVFTCPHLEAQGCACRKPRPGLLYRAVNELDYLVDLPRSFLVGDSETDTIAGYAAGLRTIQVGEPAWAARTPPTHAVRHLTDVLSILAAEDLRV